MPLVPEPSPTCPFILNHNVKEPTTKEADNDCSPILWFGGLSVRLCWRPGQFRAARASFPSGEQASKGDRGFGQTLFAIFLQKVLKKAASNWKTTVFVSHFFDSVLRAFLRPRLFAGHFGQNAGESPPFFPFGQPELTAASMNHVIPKRTNPIHAESDH